APEFIDVIAAKRIVGRNDDAHGTVDPGKLLNRDYVLDVAETRAAVFLRENDAQQPHFTKFRHDLAGKTRGFIPFHDVRGDLTLRELADATAKLVLFVGKAEIHGILAVLLWRIVRPRLPYDILHEGRRRLGGRFCEHTPIWNGYFRV